MILQRGLSDRSTAVVKECINLLKDEWLPKFCNGNPVELLKYLDVETYEGVGESVMVALLRAGLVKLEDVQSLHQYSTSNGVTTEGWYATYCLISLSLKKFKNFVSHAMCSFQSCVHGAVN